ncbi:hypothetical protein LXL04_036268 [Taraxacum kok-saghyz]
MYAPSSPLMLTHHYIERLAVKKTAAKGKAAKDPNKPKRPASAFFVFMEEFRKQYKEENPENKSVAAVGNAGGAKWKSLTESEKAPFQAKADKRKKQYEKDMDTYNNKPAASANDEADDDSDKSKSEVNDEADSDSGDILKHLACLELEDNKNVKPDFSIISVSLRRKYKNLKI